MTDWLLLAGGASSRLGQDKAKVEVAGRSLLEHAHASIAASDPYATVHVLGTDYPGGPAAAVVAGLALCESDIIGVLAVDMPFAHVALARVRDAVRRHPDAKAWIPVDDRRRQQWLCAAYSRNALIESARTRTDWSGQPFGRLVGGLESVDVLIDLDVSLLDVDTPADLDRARRESTQREE